MSNLSAQELQSFVRRIEALDDEIRALNSDKSEVFKEVKSSGFTSKTLRKVVAARRIDTAERDEQDAEFELYWNAVHGIVSDFVPARVENIDEFDAETGEIIEPIQPETANEIDVLPTVAAEVTTPDANTHGQTGTADNSGLAANVPANAEAVAKKVGQSEQEATVEQCVDNLTTFIPKPLRPYCQNPGTKCGGQGKKHCWSCQTAHDAAGAA